MEIKPVDQTIKNLLESGFYHVPRFQRPYSWDQENVSDFWNDVIASEHQDYFIGSFVLYSRQSQSDLFHIVDGQQRLTTITLLLAAVRDAFDALGAHGKAEGIQKLIERTDIDSELQFVLQTETSYPFLQDRIQRRGEPTTEHELGPEEQALKQAYDFLRAQVDDAVSAVDGDSTIPASKKQEQKGEKLQVIRDRVLRLQVISIRLDNDDDAYLIFETLNTRGKDLQVADLVKNHLTRTLRPTNRNVDTAKDKWEAILALFSSSAVSIDVNRFLHHTWISQYPYITEKRLFKELKRTIDAKTAAKFLDQLLADAKRYRAILEPSYRKWTRQEADVAASLRALAIFRVVQPVPMTLALLRAYDSKRLTLKQIRSVLRDMENFHAQFTGVTSQRTGGGTALMYASTARQLNFAQDKNATAQVLKEFVGKLRERVPPYAEFEASFLEIQFTAKNTRQKQLVQYILERLDRHKRTGAVVDYSAMTIEHIAPQDGSASSVKNDDVGRLGNLLLLDEKLNGALGTKPFEHKKKLLQSKGVNLDEVLGKATKWNSSKIAERGKHFAHIAYDKVFKV